MATRGDTSRWDFVPITSVGQCASNGVPMVVPIINKTSASVAISDRGTTAWATAVLEVKVGNSPSGPFYPLTSPVTFSASGISPIIDVSGYAFLTVTVTTAGTSGMAVAIDVCAKGES